MRLKHLPIVFCLSVFTTLFAAIGFAAADDRFNPERRAKGIAPFLDKQTIAVVHANLQRFDADAFAFQFKKILHEGQDFGWPQFIEWHRALYEAGCDDVYVVISLADLPHAPFIVFPSQKKMTVDSLRTRLALLLKKSSLIVDELSGMAFLGRQQTWERLKRLTPDARSSLADAFRAAGDTEIQVLFLPTADDRRVVEELLPALPKEIGGGPSTIVTHGIRWGALGINTHPPFTMRVVMQSADETAASALRGKWQDVIRWLAESSAGGGVEFDLKKVGALAEPEVRNSQVMLSLNSNDGSLQSLTEFVAGPFDALRMKAFAAQSMNNLKHLALCLHNFHDVKRHFPAAGTYDAAGNPLLSWRVQILPFVDQSLYKQFRLDEPWDSEHNRKLIPLMPEVFRSPPSKHRRAEGLATYQVVVGERTAFPERDGVSYKQFSDGVSRTIMLVEVDDDHATIWTKPEGLPYNAENPAAGFGGQFKGICHTARADGSAHALPLPVDAEELRRLLIRDDGQGIEER